MPLKTDKPLFDAIRLLYGPISGQQFRVLKEALTLCEQDEPDELLGNEPRGQFDVSPAGIASLKASEGCRLEAYPDPGSRDGKPWTIGYGSTGPDIRQGTTWTQEQAERRFVADIRRFENQVERLLGGADTTQAQFDALVHFAYNVGLAGLGTSQLLRYHKAGKFSQASQQFARWKYNDGKVMPGLVTRRAKEAAMYRGGHV